MSLVVLAGVVIPAIHVDIVLSVRLIGPNLLVNIRLERSSLTHRISRRLHRNRPNLIGNSMKRLTLPTQKILSPFKLGRPLNRGLPQRNGSTERGLAGVPLPPVFENPGQPVDLLSPIRF
jgi:hypothetical protein